MAPCWEILFAPKTPVSEVMSSDVKVGSYLPFQVLLGEGFAGAPSPLHHAAVPPASLKTNGWRFK